MIWALLNGRFELAFFFWDRCEDAIPLAIIACIILKAICKSLPKYDTDNINGISNLTESYETRASSLIESISELEGVSHLLDLAT
ncbi:unnamed protein product [Protopolystoma xenopodis]|uniref:TRPM-like domain-containing protein n=1 Tax=Protopolystoma xenopodis TaxID=117903 RepID=A0A448XRK5_9PLAT|nr:unnamed protein product [Protopolystoma xenopodis]